MFICAGKWDRGPGPMQIPHHGIMRELHYDIKLHLMTVYLWNKNIYFIKINRT